MRYALSTLFALLAVAVPAAAVCPQQVTYDPEVPTWESINGFELGSRQATNDEVVGYMVQLALQSEKVQAGALSETSLRGKALPYVIVSRPLNLGPKRLPATARTMRAIRRAELSRLELVAEAQTSPAIVTVASNVHGNEPSGTDASMRLLYELAARVDCANLSRLKRLLTFILPIQNPDGRELGTRGNAYGFDLNRDWFARTQPETQGKLELLQRYPPIAFVDAHEEAGESFFFPPNSDPIHHEISSQALNAINKTYAPALAAAAARDGFDYVNYSAYDLFFMGYGDTVPTTAFGAAGMTFEKGGESSYPEKTREQFSAQDATVTAAAEDKEALLEQWGVQWLQAKREGRRGELQPNVVLEPGSALRFPVPDIEVFGYFIRADRSRGDAARLARRLRSFDVAVYRLSEPAMIKGARRYGEGRFNSEPVPAGTFWIPMDQPQKHWIQALLGEDPYVPFPYFYDVASWSNPLLMGLEGGMALRRNKLPIEPWRGGSLGGVHGPGPAWNFDDDSVEAVGLISDLLQAGARVIRSRTWAIATDIGRSRLARLARRRDVVLRTFDASPPPRHAVDLELPYIAILNDQDASARSANFAEYAAAERLGLQNQVGLLRSSEMSELEGEGFTAVVVPDQAHSLDAAGLKEIARFVRRGGRYVGIGRTGLNVAQAAGLTLAHERVPPLDFQVPGASFRMSVDPSEPVGFGFKEESWLFNLGDPLLLAHEPTGTVAARYPGGDRFFVAGYTEGEDTVRGSPVAITQEIGDGQSIIFSFDPNFRGYTESTMRMFGNALLYPVAGQGAIGGFRMGIRPGLLARAVDDEPEAVIRVPLAAEAVLRVAARAAGVPEGARITRDLRGVSLRVPTPPDDEPEWAPLVLERLERAGARPSLVVLRGG